MELSIAQIRSKPIRPIELGGHSYSDNSIKAAIFVSMLEVGQIERLPRICSALIPGLRTRGIITGPGMQLKLTEEGQELINLAIKENF